MTKNEIEEKFSALFEELKAALPKSTDGFNCEVVSTFTEVAAEEDEGTSLFCEISFNMKDAPRDGAQIFSCEIKLCEDEASVTEVESLSAALASDVKSFYEGMEGSSHTEYLSALFEERESILNPRAPEQTPFNYNSFFLGAGLGALVIIVLLLLGKAIF